VKIQTVRRRLCNIALKSACLVGISLAALVFSGQTTQPVPSQPAVLQITEMTLDRAPGTEGSWIELHNPGSNPFSTDNLTIIFNGAPCADIPKGIAIPPKGILLIRFAATPRADLQETAWSYTNFDSATIVLAAKRGGGAPKRELGYCALFNGTPGANTMLDFLMWGESNTNAPADQLKWATDAGLWKGRSVYLGPTEPAPGDRPVPVPAVAFRIFQSPAKSIWKAYGEDRGTPGQANLLPPPVVTFNNHMAADQDLTFRVGFDYEVPEPAPGEKKYQIQISTDPHFTNIVVDEAVDDLLKLKEGILRAGTYFIRARSIPKAHSSNWSPNHYLQLH
jgi:hypothetical protein